MLLDVELTRVRETVKVALQTGEADAPASPVDGPLCPFCRADLVEFTAYHAVEAVEHEGEGRRRIPVVFCRRCGHALGTYEPPV